MGSQMSFDEKRRDAAARYFNGGPVAFGGRELTKTEAATDMSRIQNDALCVFDDDSRRSGYVEVTGRRIRFRVRDDGSLLVIGTDEPQTPEYVRSLEIGAEQANKQREAELAINTLRHEKRWKV